MAVGATLDGPTSQQALFIGDRLVTCAYTGLAGMFIGENTWQTGNTLESLADFMLAANSTRWLDVLETS